MAKQKIRPLSGFPEWLPGEKLVEQHVLDRLRCQFELFGFTPLETRAVEPLATLLKQGETDKEIYTLRRLQADAGEEAELGLHYDLTVPFARYVAQHRGQLAFPLRRYQIQKAWRGERPQEGRYREFYQADIDVIAEHNLPLHVDGEMPCLLHAVTSALPMPPVTVFVNNRKILEGFYRGLGVERVTEALRTVDKLDKIGPEEVARLLREEVGVPAGAEERILALGEIRGGDAGVLEAVRGLGVEHELLATGLEELGAVLAHTAHLPAGAVVADLHIARGFDYYTGTVYEGLMQGYEAVGAVCSGGRYDNLAGAHGGAPLPGVGVSVGVSRILGCLLGEGRLTASRQTPACLLVVVHEEATRPQSETVARALRARGIPCEVAAAASAYGKQIRAAERRGIPFVWFPPREEGDGHEVKDIRSGQQAPADPGAWVPPAEDRAVGVTLDAQT